MRFFLAFLRVIVFWGFSVSSWAQTPPLLAASAYWIDASGAATFEAARQASFTDYTGSLRKGYTNATVWIKLRIAAVTETQPLVLTVTPSFLRKIELYDPLQFQDGGAMPQLSGRISPFEGASFSGVENGFSIPSSPQVRDVYLRIETPTSMIVTCNVENLTQATNANQMRVIGLTLYVGFLMLTALWGLIHGLIQQDGLYGFFMFRQLYAGLYVLSFTGLLRYWAGDSLDPLTRDFIYNFVLVTIVLPIGLFETQLLRNFGVSQCLLKWSRNVLLLSMLSLVLIALGMVRQALNFNFWVVFLYFSSLTLTAYTAKALKDSFFENFLVWVIRIGYTFIFVVVLLPVMSFLSLLPTNWLIINSTILISSVSTMLMVFLLSIRTRQKNMQMQDMQTLEAVTQAQLISEKERRIEKENFLSMLAHELRNPLTVIRMRSDSQSPDGQAVHRAAGAMARVLERVQQSQKQEDADQEPVKVEFDLRNLLAELCADSKQPDRLEMGLPPLATLVTDRDLLRAILSNLIDNALKYSPGGTPVQLNMELGPHEGQAGIRFMVSNVVGVAGLPEPGKVFSKYYRSPGAHREVGSGLGLYLIALWSRSLGGQVAYQASPSDLSVQKVVFSIWIPQ